MERYFDAKLQLFDGRTGERPRVSVVNLDDEYGARLTRELEAAGGRVITYAFRRDADVTARNVNYSLAGNRFELQTPAGSRDLASPLVGQPHVYNVLAAAACGLALGYDLDSISRGVETCAGAPGRFERVAHAGDFAVVVDYAHTDDALKNVLRSAREVAAKGARVITVFGCGGDRDRTKRAPMGEAAASLSDVVIVTSDNPRTEDPSAILRDAEVGLKKVGKPYLKIADRREAIERAIQEAGSGDVVVIAGKGHEQGQEADGTVTPFDDRIVVRQAIAAHGAGAA
jgi:UDP-N-acetylmuramyl-tripeptide synthetase